MKKLLLLLMLPVAMMCSCSKSNISAVDTSKQAAIDDAAIKTYLTAHPEITNVKDTLGVYYQITTAGTGALPTDASTITVNYTGSLLNGTQFGNGTNFTGTLSNMIIGWRIVLPHVKIGSTILMIVPSLYGYGTLDQVGIPANSVLLFNLTLLPPNNE